MGVEVAELYWGTTSAFVEHTKQNEITGRLKQAFFDAFGWEPPESEVRSWRNSLKALSNAIELGRLDDHGLLLEYQLPLTSKRLDAMITGHDRDGRPAAVIVEL
ncbi:MAG: peptidase S24, partial [Nitriliruptoraceae bacterium]